ncbi:hypothetical protein [Clostridium sp.]|nr:hypothetical protein [Clostridium sp.]MCI9303084.1 hypothetical protein [Clostridium sp.]
MRINCRLKLVFIIIIAIIVLAIPLAAQVNGKINECKIDKYIAIGDEISLDSRESYDVKYVSLIKEFLYSLNENLEYYNLSEKGINSSDLLNIIENNKKKIKDADLITISIGGNNILNSVLKNLNIDKELIKNYNEEEFDSIISKHLNSENIKNEILNEINNFSKDFLTIIEEIKSLAPKARIYVNKVYNPINKNVDTYNFFENKINLINEIILKHNNNYKILGSYQEVSNDNVLNFKIEENEIKLQLNKVEHAMIATQVISDFEDYVSLKVDKVTSSNDNIKGRTLPNSNIIIMSEEGTLGVAQANEDGKFRVKIPKMLSGTNLGILVYDENIFSILYKSKKLVVEKDLFTS